jgi:hypothetical protein
VGQHATLADLNNDWELTHEMIHFGFPSVEDPRWIEGESQLMWSRLPEPKLDD